MTRCVRAGRLWVPKIVSWLVRRLFGGGRSGSPSVSDRRQIHALQCHSAPAGATGPRLYHTPRGSVARCRAQRSMIGRRASIKSSRL